MKREEILASIFERKVVSVLRTKEPEKLKSIINALDDGGISVAEITMTVPNAIQLIEEVTSTTDRDIIVGVGSVLNKETAEAAIKAGAKYVVSPILKKEVIEMAHKYDVPAMPGCFTPTEIQAAYEMGADVVKVFPADVLGMAFFKGVLAPMPHLKLMPTGGVTLTNAGDWIKSGACAVGVGSALLNKEAIDSGDYARLTENAKIIMNSVKSVLK